MKIVLALIMALIFLSGCEGIAKGEDNTPSKESLENLCNGDDVREDSLCEESVSKASLVKF